MARLVSWTDGDGTVATIGVDDILVMAPYNAQVRELTEALPEGSRVDTVDRFQGQEAAAVIVSLAASRAQDVPRGNVLCRYVEMATPVEVTSAPVR